MKRIFIIAIHKRLLSFWALCLIIPAIIVFIAAAIQFTWYLQAFSSSEATGIPELEKENSMIRNLLSSLIPQEQKIILEDEHRNIFMNAGITPPPPLPASPLSNVLARGVETKFRILSDDTEYLRPVYDPDWKWTYYRGWLYLPYKNMEARHRIFAFSLGGSANYDIFGSLGFSPKSGPNAPIDNHRNINFLIYGFDVKSVKVFENQVALAGEPRQTGAQVVSIVQNDLLPEGVDTKDFLFQLSTPKGYEVDFLNHNIIRYEYLMEQIKEHTVHPSFADEIKSRTLEELLKENAALKQELTFFVPSKDEVVTQQNFHAISGNQDEIVDIPSAMKQGRKIPFSFNYENPQYNRPLYDPLWKTNYKRMWCYIPEQIASNMHRLHVIPQDHGARYDFFGKLGFHENYQPIKSGQYGFLVYNFDVTQAVIYKNQLLLSGIPSRSGARIISIKPSHIKGYANYPVRLITPDNCQIDCHILMP